MPRHGSHSRESRRRDDVALVDAGTPVESVALDGGAGKLYFTDPAAGRVRRSNVDGTGIEVVIPTRADAYDVDLYLSTP